jgi:hypothetical protein
MVNFYRDMWRMRSHLFFICFSKPKSQVWMAKRTSGRLWTD